MILSSSPTWRIVPSAVQTFLKPCLLRASFNISTLLCVRVSVNEMFEPLKVFLLEKILLARKLDNDRARFVWFWFSQSVRAIDIKVREFYTCILPNIFCDNRLSVFSFLISSIPCKSMQFRFEYCSWRPARFRGLQLFSLILFFFPLNFLSVHPFLLLNHQTSYSKIQLFRVSY